MLSTDDTIVAVATPPGRGALAVIRVSGPAARPIADQLAGAPVTLRPRRATRVRLRGCAVPDDALMTWFPSPHSYTGQDVVEVSVHGGSVSVAAVMEAAVARGARHADRGEFTLRAFVHGKLDLLQAEAVHDLVSAVSPAQARSAIDHLSGALSGPIHGVAMRLRELQVTLEASLDFPDEGYRFATPDELLAALRQVRTEVTRLIATGRRGRVVRDGVRVVIVGAPNVGKSSLFNALVGAERAIVTDRAGTTRDLVSARIVANGECLELVDTAGARQVDDPIEQEGVRRAHEAALQADRVVVVVDRSRALGADDRVVLDAWQDRPHVVAVAHKSDLPATSPSPQHPLLERALAVSSVTHDGVAQLLHTLTRASEGAADDGEPLVTNHRHVQLLERVAEHVDRAIDALEGGGAAEELIASDVQGALAGLEELTGVRSSEDLLREIFSRFCIGK